MIGANQDEGIGFPGAQILADDKLLKEFDAKWDDVILLATQLHKFVPAGDKEAVSKKIRKFYFGDKPVSKETRANITNLFSDIWFVHSSWRSAIQTVRKAEGDQVYLYQYVYRGPACAMKLFGLPIAEEEEKKVGHGNDCLLQFNLEGMLPQAADLIKADSEDEVFSKNLIKLWTSFAINGKPTHTWIPSMEEWKPITKSQLDGQTPPRWYRLNSNPGYFNEKHWNDRIAFWDNLYKDHILNWVLYSAKSGTKNEKKIDDKTEL